jgi:hypothetical protein
MTTMRNSRSRSSVRNFVARLEPNGVRLSLALLVLFSLAACGGGEKGSTSSDQEPAPAVPESGAGAAASSAAAPAKTYQINDPVEYDGWTVVVLRAQPKWVSDSERPSAGARLVAVELQVTNKAEKVRNSPIPFFCTLVQSAGGEHLGLLVVAGPSPRFDRSNIPPNQPRTGWATFQAADVEGLLLQCEPGADPDVSINPDTKLIWNLRS